MSFNVQIFFGAIGNIRTSKVYLIRNINLFQVGIFNNLMNLFNKGIYKIYRI